LVFAIVSVMNASSFFSAAFSFSESGDTAWHALTRATHKTTNAIPDILLRVIIASLKFSEKASPDFSKAASLQPAHQIHKTTHR
jgi:hypothetical protein